MIAPLPTGESAKIEPVEALPIPPGARFFEKGDGLPVLKLRGGGYISVPTGFELRSLDDLIEVGRARFDEMVAGWPPAGRLPAPAEE